MSRVQLSQETAGGVRRDGREDNRSSLIDQGVVREIARLLQRCALATIGTTSGLFVGLHVGSSFASLTTQGFLIAMMVVGSVSFYLGIDTERPWVDRKSRSPWNASSGPKSLLIDVGSYAGTISAAVAASCSVAIVALGFEPRIHWTAAIFAAWILGASMQIVAGSIARIGR
jgi:hypothetical protein